MTNSYTLNYLYFLLLLLLTACGTKSTHVKDTPPSPFQGDSGYLTKQQLLPYAVENRVTDTAGAGNYWADLDEGDTIAKFYRYKGGHLACMLEFVPPAESLLLFEVAPDGTPEKRAQYVHGKDKPYRHESFSFGRIKEYFYIRTFDSGPTHHTSVLFLFREFEQQTPEHAIYEYMSHGDNSAYKALSLSSVQTDGDMLHTEYVVKASSSKAPEKEVDRFKLDYIFTMGAWVPDDSLVYKTRLKGF